LKLVHLKVVIPTERVFCATEESAVLASTEDLEGHGFSHAATRMTLDGFSR
jgi:hypothetical protein